jgi:hypothetical protein
VLTNRKFIDRQIFTTTLKGKIMTLNKTIKNIATGAVTGVALATALPLAGAVGTLTAAGAAVASTVGALAGLIDSLTD